LKRGLLVVLFGPSGAGKDVLLREALPNIPGLNRCISATTRPPRPGELPGKDHLYVSEERFTRMIESGDFLEHTRYVGHGYGTPKAWVEDMLASGRDVVLRVEVQGALQLRKLAPEAPSVFLAPPSWDELRRRLEARHTDASESIEERLRVARQEVWEAEHGNGGRPMYDYLIVNDDLKEASRRFEAIVAAERCRAGRADLSYLED
jgi:guanylate kinase